MLNNCDLKCRCDDLKSFTLVSSPPMNDEAMAATLQSDAQPAVSSAVVSLHQLGNVLASQLLGGGGV